MRAGSIFSAGHIILGKDLLESGFDAFNEGGLNCLWGAGNFCTIAGPHVVFIWTKRNKRMAWGIHVLVQVFPGKWVARVHMDVRSLALGGQMAIGIIFSWSCRGYYLR